MATSDLLQQLGIEVPTNSNLSSLGLFHNEYVNEKGKVASAKFKSDFFKSPKSTEELKVIEQIISNYPALTFCKSRVEFHCADSDDDRMIYTDDYDVFLFIVTNMHHLIHTIMAPVDGIVVQEWNFLKQLQHFDKLKDIGFYRRDSLDKTNTDLLTEEQVHLYTELIQRSIRTKNLQTLRNPEMCFEKVIDDLINYKLKELHLEFDEADFLEERDIKLSVDRLVFRANFFKPSKLFSKFNMKSLDITIRMKFVKPTENVIVTCPSVKSLVCKVSYFTNLDQIFDYLVDVFPSLELIEIDAIWGISGLTSYENYGAGEKLKKTMKDCVRMIDRLESAGLRAKSKGDTKPAINLCVKILLPQEDTIFYDNKAIANEFRQIIFDVANTEFGTIDDDDEDDDSSPGPIVRENGVVRSHRMIDFFLGLESSF